MAEPCRARLGTIHVGSGRPLGQGLGPSTAQVVGSSQYRSFRWWIVNSCMLRAGLASTARLATFGPVAFGRCESRRRQRAGHDGKKQFCTGSEPMVRKRAQYSWWTRAFRADSSWASSFSWANQLLCGFTKLREIGLCVGKSFRQLWRDNSWNWKK